MQKKKTVLSNGNEFQNQIKQQFIRIENHRLKRNGLKRDEKGRNCLLLKLTDWNKKMKPTVQNQCCIKDDLFKTISFKSFFENIVIVNTLF